jgi:hypothetical protein
MALTQTKTFEGLFHNLDERDRLAAYVALNDKDSIPQIHKIRGHALVDSADSVVSWTQPAYTLLSRIWVVCTTAPVVATGDIGFEVGTSSSDAQIVATSSDTLLDGGTTALVAGLGIPLTLVAHGDASAGLYGSSASRTLYFNLTATTDASAQGEFMWIIETISTVDTNTDSGTNTSA